MGSFSMWHWLILIMVAVLLFGGKGKISNLMGDLAQGIKQFKEGLKEPEATIADKRDAADAKKADEVKQS